MLFSNIQEDENNFKQIVLVLPGIKKYTFKFLRNRNSDRYRIKGTNKQTSY